MSVIGSLLLASGPAILEPEVVSVVESPTGKQAWIALGSEIDRFDEESKRWLGVTDYSNDGIDSEITDIIQIDGLGVLASTTGHGIIQLDHSDGSLLGTISGSDFAPIDELLYDRSSGNVFVSMPQFGVAIGNTSDLQRLPFFDEESGLDSLEFTSMAFRSDILYIGTIDAGVMRIEVSSNLVLSSWRSLGVDNLDEAPLAIIDNDDRILMGIPKGLALIIIDRFTGGGLHIWDEADGTLPDNDINDIHLDVNGNIIISTEGPAWWNPGAVASWMGLTTFSQRGRSSQEVHRAQIHSSSMRPLVMQMESTLVRTGAHACGTGPSMGPTVGVRMTDSLLRFVNTVAMLEANRLYAGTSEGVGIIDTSTGTLVDVWTAAADSIKPILL